MEERIYAFSKFALKVTHAAATTLQMLAMDKEEAGLDKEDTKFLYKFLAKNWASVLLASKGKDKEENKDGAS